MSGAAKLDVKGFDLKGYLAGRKALVDEALLRWLPEEPGTPWESVVAAMRYSLLAGGKRVRPVLALAGAEAVLKGDAEEAAKRVMPFACALECIHTYSLIHDDLPAMDNDDLRRGRPTSHKVFGEAMAILAGDALLTFAFRLVTDQGRFNENVTPTQALSAASLLSEAAGFRGMIGGQVVDIASEGKEDGTLSDLRQLHRLKTGALIRASVSGGGLLAGANSAQLEALVAYGQAVGLAFQVADDILDVVGQAAVMGKNVGGDARKGKLTYPGLLGLEGARAEAARLLEASLAALEPLGQPAVPLAAIARYIVERTN